MAIDLEPMASSDSLNQELEALSSYRFPCSVSQRACWFIDQITPGTPANNIAVRFRLDGEVRPELLENAFRAIVDRHEILRTRFLPENGEPMQIVEPGGEITFDFVSLLSETPAERSRKAEELAAQEALLGFDLTRLPLFRAKLLQTAETEFILLVTIHHIVSDGWSIGLLTDELGVLYESLAAGTSPELPALEIQYGDYACWQKEQIQEGKTGALLAAIGKKLDGFTPVHIPTDLARPIEPTSRGSIRSVLLPRELTDRLQEFSAGQRCTLFVTMLSTFLMLLHRESGQTDLVVRTQATGRDRTEVEPLIGWFVNSILLRCDLEGDPDFPALVRRVQETVTEAFGYKDVPFELMMETVRPKRSLHRHPPFQVNFIFQKDLVHPWTRGGISMTPLPSKAAGTFVDLNFFLVERRDGWRLSVDVNEDVFLVETGEYFLRVFSELLELVAANPGRRVSAYEVSEARPGNGSVSLSAPAKALEAPRNSIERELVRIWQEVLHTEPIGVHSNFFDLGGHSLLAVQMLSRVQEECGSRISLARLFRDPTIAAMAEALGGPAGQPNGGPVPIQPRGSRTPLFMIGGDHFFRPLAQHLGLDQPMLGISLQKYEGRTEPTPFEEIAREVAASIIEQYPSGPYLLAGWCVDGSIAYETAKRLSALDREVGLVALIDCINPSYRRELQSTGKAIARALKRTGKLAAAALHSGAGRLSTLRAGFAEMGRRTQEALGRGSRVIPQDPVIVQNDPDRQEFRRLLYVSERAYTPRPIDVPVVLLRSGLNEHQVSHLGWAGVARRSLEVIEIPGGHIEMFREPHVRELAAALSGQLARAGESKNTESSAPHHSQGDFAALSKH